MVLSQEGGLPGAWPLLVCVGSSNGIDGEVPRCRLSCSVERAKATLGHEEWILQRELGISEGYRFWPRPFRYLRCDPSQSGVLLGLSFPCVCWVDNNTSLSNSKG